jgi:hypothetical protein
VAPGGDLPAVTGIDFRDPRVLEDARSGSCGRAREADQVLHGIELRLVRKLQCTRGLERQRRTIEHGRLKADRPRRLRLTLDVGATIAAERSAFEAVR